MKIVKRFSATALSTALLAATAMLTGCIVAPPRPPPIYYNSPPPAVVYVAPNYPMPDQGYVWLFHPRWGWGWAHPRFGWHRGWR